MLYVYVNEYVLLLMRYSARWHGYDDASIRPSYMVRRSAGRPATAKLTYTETSVGRSIDGSGWPVAKSDIGCAERVGVVEAASLLALILCTNH